MHTLEEHQFLFEKYLEEFCNKISETRKPNKLYEPISYLLSIGGKRLRPLLLLQIIEGYGVDYRKGLDAAMAIEVFHNFTLMHDDIMDCSSMRRGQATVHEKWNNNTAILSGDAMLIQSYQFLESYKDNHIYPLLKCFSDTALKICEGQQYDINFETEQEVKLEDYIQMITYKTAVLLGASLQIGSIIADKDAETQKLAYEFGCCLGISFQLQDDYLDTYGDTKTFGKRIGGDIIQNKKTFLYLKTLELLEKSNKQEDHKILQLHYRANEQKLSLEKEESKIELIKKLFSESGAKEALRKEIKHYSNRSRKILNDISIEEKNKNNLLKFILKLENRME